MTRPRWLQDPAAPSIAAFMLLALVGFATIVLGWRAVARTRIIPVQIPAAISGGAIGLAIVLIGIGLASVQVGRRLAAAERAQTEQLIEEAAGLLDALTEQPQTRSSS